jgi:hypothetical protein
MDLIEQKKITSAQFRRHPWEIARLHILLFLLRKQSSKKFILDVGSGDAFIAIELSKKFPDSKLVAVDINYDEQFIKDSAKNNIAFLKHLNNLPANLPVDSLLLMDVAEHIERPEELLEDIKALKNISSSSQLIITVPAFQFLFNEHDIFLKHFRRYNRKQLNLLLHKEGFEIKYSGYFFFTLFVGRCFQKLLRLKQEQGVHNWDGSKLITSIITTILLIDFKICWYLSRIGINLPGLSCYCICHPLPS